MKTLCLSLCRVILLSAINIFAQSIPLPEHPRPDFERAQWQNLNGIWHFEFDKDEVGIREEWYNDKKEFSKRIKVPFPWGSELSGVKDEADIAWYKREININPEWEGMRIFLTIGASDWETTVWIDGICLGKHQGGYTPFFFELTDYVKYGQPQSIIIRADDKRRDFTLYGKQGYGNARGIWQTVYLEARGKEYLDAVHFSPDIDKGVVSVTAYFPEKLFNDQTLIINIQTGGEPINFSKSIPKGRDKIQFEIKIPDQHLWSLDDPFLYNTIVRMGDDEVKTYFGMRKLSIVDLPGTDYKYVALNDKPVYLQLALDQSYTPNGFYTFPSDEFMKNEIALAKSIGLNGIRIHIKVEIPRKLYWADKLGFLVMQDLPNSWGEPDEKMQIESERTFRAMVKRDYNHPSIFSWILFNETWGLGSTVYENGEEKFKYTPQTQKWVVSMYYLAKSLDPTRLAEDNSICCGRGHTITDINSFHDYLPGWKWEDKLKEITENSYRGSTFQFEKGYMQGDEPKINSECGNVWGYEGSTGDIDWSFDYHRMINTFRMYPEISGWLYTEHHDVINEWNGYWRYDRSGKFTGLEEIMEGMTVNDFHSQVYLSTGNEICRTVKGGDVVLVPLFLSSMTDNDFGDHLIIKYKMEIENSIGESFMITENNFEVIYKPYIQKSLDPLKLTMPDVSGLATLKLIVGSADGKVLHHNFMNFIIESEKKLNGTEIIAVPANQFSNQEWSLKQWNVMDGLKVNGAGSGFFEYTFYLPEEIKYDSANETYFLIELSAKQLFVKDTIETAKRDLDYMLGDKAAPSFNQNSYPMTDEEMFPSSITISINGKEVHSTTLPDDPADHRGVLSWHSQLKDGKLREAGSYGYLVKVPISKKLLDDCVESGKMVVTIKTNGEGGIAVYGKSFGRHPVDPSLVFKF